MRYSVSKEVLDNILQYLAAQPYAQVSALIASLSKDAKKLQADAAAEAPKAEVVSEDQAAS